MEHGLGDYLRGIADEESAGETACYEAATKHSLTTEQADNCDAGELGCPTCPWRSRE